MKRILIRLGSGPSDLDDSSVKVSSPKVTPGCVKFTAEANYGTPVVPRALAVPGKIARLSTHSSWQTGRVLHGTNLERKLLTRGVPHTLSEALTLPAPAEAPHSYTHAILQSCGYPPPRFDSCGPGY